MADEKTFTESEHIAILTDRVTTETASLTEARDQLANEKADLQNKLDVAESAKVAAEQRAEKAESDLKEFKDSVEESKAAAARKDDRLAKVKETAAHLGDDFFTDEARVARIVAMDEDGFEGYLADLKATAPAPGSTTTAPPRETAMAGAAAVVPGTPGAPSAAREFLLGRYVPKGDD